ncbi:glycosyl hydrolase [Lipomyces starkeyi]|uniref:Glycosyl hydrolase family 32 N-terminal domain-containing protein n=1 Tax=Lipomyces starkeyi NRRL Y-11557 TaxID=675824 RepID=A0A1E3QGP8_LIPST|nr:hypothetical protein LIPSTDRAFT_142956 [Lipomyces starkeyi NRRL Y-11557]
MTVIANRNEGQRPALHFTPKIGFMNDPNGLVYSKGVWHLYYQLNDRNLVAGHPEWGHATSTDLLTWKWHEKAIKAPSDHESIFSGCCVVDCNNTSGEFDESTGSDDRIVAIYTLHTQGHQTQDIAFSSDGGYIFTPYKHNPVLDIGWADFRDPKVLWHALSNQWVMVVAKCHQFKVGFYGSPDLVHWHHLSDFEGAGVRGYQYEMPNLVEVPFDDDNQRKKWVLFLSIGPGAPLGGSFTQYYVGEFDGTNFTSDDNYLRTADLGKDWYAAQTWFNSPDGKAYGIGWASNWQYCNRVPAERYRSAMSLPRKFTVREVPLNANTKSLSLISRPIDLSIARLPSNDAAMVYTNGSAKISPSIDVIYQRHMQGSTGAFEFKLNIKSVTSPARVTVDIANPSGRSVQLNFVVDDQGMFISMDRGRIRTGSSWDHPLFDDKVCMWVPSTQTVYDVHVIIDVYVCELFAIDGAYAFTNTFFLQDGVASTLTVSQEVTDTEVFDVYELCPLASA